MSKRLRNTLFNYFTSNNPSQEISNEEVEDGDVNYANTVTQMYAQPSKFNRVDLSNLPSDPGLGKNLSEFHPDDKEEIRRHYVMKEPFQPRNINFPTKVIGGNRHFNPDWYDTYGDWLEYSIVTDDAYCRYCYLFKSDESQKGGGEAFVTNGWSSWNKKERLDTHVGGVGSSHNQAYIMFEALKKQQDTIKDAFNIYTDKEKEDY